MNLKLLSRRWRPDWHWSVEWCLNDWRFLKVAATSKLPSLSIHVVSEVQNLTWTSLEMCILNLNVTVSNINSYLWRFLHDSITRSEENIDGALVVWTIIWSSDSKVWEVNIISSCLDIHYADVGLVSLFAVRPIEIRLLACESRWNVGNLCHMRFYIAHPPPSTIHCMRDDFTTRRLSPEGVIS